MQAAIVDGDVAFLQLIADRIAIATDRDPPQIEIASSMHGFLGEVLSAIAPAQLLLLIDEYELIETKWRKGNSAPTSMVSSTACWRRTPM